MKGEWLKHQLESDFFEKGDIFRCRKCRNYLFDARSLKEVHERMAVDSPTCSSWYMKDDDFLPWIQDAINQTQWTEGKIYCPKCNGRIGAFDFIHGVRCSCEEFVLPAIWIPKTRVDHVKGQTEARPNIRLPFARLSRGSAPYPSSFGKQNLDSSKKTVQNVDATYAVGDNPQVVGSCATKCVPNAEGAQVATKAISCAQPHNSEPPDGELSNNLLARNCAGISNQNEVRNNEDDSTESTTKARNQCQSGAGKPFGMNTAGAKTAVIHDDHMCPVCLELLYEPFACSCGHVFCDPCLRQLHAKCKKDLLNCPLCRQTVMFVSTAAEVRSEIQILYPELLRALLEPIPLNARAIKRSRHVPPTRGFKGPKRSPSEL